MGHSHNIPARRNFLKMSARLAALGLTSLGVQPARQFFVRDVEAQSRVTDYKALVCVYMFGGNDANNLIVPADNYAAYSSARGGTGGVAITSVGIMPARRLDQSFAVVQFADYEGVEVFVQNYPEGQWRARERERFIDAVERIEQEEENR